MRTLRERRPVARAVVLGLCLGAGGCAGEDHAKSPEGAVQLLLAAARAGDRGAVYQRLGPATRGRIDAALTASRKALGRVALRPEDLLSVGWAPPAWDPAGMRTLRRDDRGAEVEVHSATGDRHTVSLVREGTEWKIELPAR